MTDDVSREERGESQNPEIEGLALGRDVSSLGTDGKK